MKEIKAYIHNHRIADVIRALKESELCNTDGTPGCHNLAVVPVKVPFKAMGSSEQHYSIELAEVVVNEFKLELVCEDQQVDELVNLIGRVSHTSQTEAGWIYVSEVVSATVIR